MNAGRILGAAIQAVRLLRKRDAAVYLLYSSEQQRAWVGTGVSRHLLARGSGQSHAPAVPLRCLSDVFAELREEARARFFLIGPPAAERDGQQASAIVIQPTLELSIDAAGVRPSLAAEGAELAEFEAPLLRTPEGCSPLDALPLLGSNAMTGWSGESDESYCQRLARAVELTRGRTGKIIVTRRYFRGVPRDAGALELVEQLGAREPGAAAIHFAELPGGFASLGSSPENVIESRAGSLLVDAVAGTRKRHPDPALDQALRAELCESSKELREHAMAVARAEQFAASVCEPGSVRVEFARQVRRLRAVQHLHSRLAGHQRSGVCFASLLEHCHPPLSSYPPELARSVAPPWPGRFYGGMVGRIEGRQDGASFLNLRCLELEQGELNTYAGVGVVDGSSVRDELDEVRSKLTTVRDAVNGWLRRARG